jgi:GT2 family glycosyltransferase
MKTQVIYQKKQNIIFSLQPPRVPGMQPLKEKTNNILNKRIHVIVITYNGKAWIRKCFGSLLNSTVPLEIYAIDNGSSDGTASLIKENFPAVHLIETGTNLGFGKANNIGLKMAVEQNADYVFLLNQDTWIEKNTIAELLSVAENNKEYGILSPFHLSINDNRLETQFTEFLSYKFTGMLASDMYFNQLKAVYPTTYIHAASWFMPLCSVKKIGAFDPLFAHYGEDDDYMQRAQYFGIKMGLVPKALLTHDGVYKTWQMVEWDKNRNLIVAYQQLKRMVPKFHSNLLAYLKTSFDELTTLLLFRKFKKFKFRLGVFYTVLKNMKKIRKSYHASFNEGAFL